MFELVIISGKGGVGKTSITASFAVLAAGDAIIADCDVDAPDLHLLLKPALKEKRDFIGAKKPMIDATLCRKCGLCARYCRFEAIDPVTISLDESACEGCGVCARVCPTGAITLRESVNGYLYISETAYGPMVHAQLKPGEENSGKLVAMVKQEAGKLSSQYKKELIIVDGPPGVGCPVIASVTGADGVLVVTEPTLSGAHDMARAVQLAKHFQIPAAVLINKSDINEDKAKEIVAWCKGQNVPVLGMLPYDENVTRAIREGRAPVEVGGEFTKIVREVWENILQSISAAS